MARDPYIVGVTLGRWQTNCFVIGDRTTGVCVIVDPGEGGAEAVPDILKRLDATCEAILLTHGHIDHVWAVPDLAATLDVPAFLHPADRWLWEAPVAAFGDFPAEERRQMLHDQMGLDWTGDTTRLVDVADHDVLTFGGLTFTVRHNPGHTPGHVTFLGRDMATADIAFQQGEMPPSDQILFSGDLIFAGSVGRTDFPRGSSDDLMTSIRDTVLPLEDQTLILSGHGPGTTVGRERATNPFVAQARRGL